jgi:cytochrome c-type biogenesis protein CcmI
MTSLGWITVGAVTLLALAFALWPLLRRGQAPASAGAPPAADDRRLELDEEKTSIYRALKELEFDRDAGHLSDDDYRSLRDRYESRAAQILSALDALGPATVPAARAAAPATVSTRRPWTRHPATLITGALIVLAFGVVIGAGVSRYTEPDRTVSAEGGRPPAPAPASPVGPPAMSLEPGKPIPPEILAGMLKAARESLNAGRYSEAIAAYQAVLKRDPKNVDAMTHLGLIVAIGGHADAALETFKKVIAIDPAYAPVYLYRGEVLYEVKQDYPGALQAWERFLTLVPKGEDHDRVVALVKEARSKQGPR